MTKPVASCPGFAWTPVEHYVQLIMERSDEREWGFQKFDAIKLALKLTEHANLLTPTSVNIWLGKNLAHNWLEAIFWIKDGVESLNYDLKVFFESTQLSFLQGSQPTKNGQIGMDAVVLDLKTFWGHIDNGIPWWHNQPTNIVWPGLEVAWLLALNPQIFIGMDGKTIPYLLASGLTIDENDIPCFHRDGRKLCIGHSLRGNNWQKEALVCYR